MTVANKIQSGYIFSVLILLVVSVNAYLMIRDIGTELSHALNRTHPVIQNLQLMREQILKVDVKVSDSLLKRQLMAKKSLSVKLQDEIGHEWSVANINIDETLKQYQHLIASYFPDELELAKSITAELVGMQHSLKNLLSMPAAETEEIIQHYSQMEQHIDRLMELTAEGLEDEMEEFGEYREDIDNELETHLYQMLLISLLAMVSMLLFGAGVSRAIARPLVNLDGAMVEVSQGNLDLKLEIQSRDEIGDLTRVFNQMIQDLQKNTIGLEYLERILDSLAEGLVVTDMRGIILRSNRALSELLGRDPTGLSFPELGITPEEILELMRQVESRPSMETQLYDNNKETIEVELFCTEHQQNNTLQGFVILIQDVRDRKQAQAHLNFLANYDTLTGLPNRHLLSTQLHQILARLPWSNRHVALLFCDLDRFMMINDSLGHKVGDRLLQQVGKRLQKMVRPGDVVARIGGDEFVILLDELAHIDDVVPVAQKVIQTISEPMQVEEHELRITSSIGIAIAPEHGSEVAELIKNADLAMYAAKKDGKNTFQIYDSSMSQRSYNRLRLEGSLRNALENNRELSVHYQPQFTIAGQLIGFEALVRWHNPELGFLSPAHFLPAAAEAGLMAELDIWVMKEACREVRSWRDLGWGDDLRVAVNLSNQMFARTDLIELVQSALTQNQLPPEALELELTEEIVMVDIETAVKTMNRLRRFGLTLSIDDFGTGYSSLGQLKRCPINTLKIDRSFVDEINSNVNDAAITEAIIAMAHKLQISTLAEGVEEDEQLRCLQQFDVDALQGYYLSRPLPAEALSEFIEQLPELQRRIFKTV